MKNRNLLIMYIQSIFYIQMHRKVFNALKDANFDISIEEDISDEIENNGNGQDQSDSDQMQKETNSSNQTAAIKNAIIKFFVKDRLPLAKMDSVHFNNLINGNLSILINQLISIGIGIHFQLVVKFDSFHIHHIYYLLNVYTSQFS